MQKKKQALFLLVIMICAITHIPKVFASFGESCATISTTNNSISYLTNNSIYGYLLNNIDMKTYVSNACDANGEDLKFCIRNATGAPSVCQQVLMHNGDSVRLGDISSNPDIGGNILLRDIMLTAEVTGGRLCLLMATARGKMPIVCRIYSQEQIDEQVQEQVRACSMLGDSCYYGNTRSQSLLNFSGMTVDCLRQTLSKVFFDGPQCRSADPEIEESLLSPFAEFAAKLRNAVFAALILYVMLYGFKLVLNIEFASLNQVVMFVLKFILVLYLAVGLGPTYIQNGQAVKQNGMTATVLPLLTSMTTDFAEIVFKAAGSQGLCSFDESRYPQGYEFYKLWDALDCRLGYYLGMRELYNIGTLIMAQSSSSTSSSDTNDPIYDYDTEIPHNIFGQVVYGGLMIFRVLIAFLIGGDFIVCAAGFAVAILFFFAVVSFISSYLACLTTLYIMAYIAPIFIPMVLFEQTKSYFDAWLKIVISCSLQPAVIAGAMALLLTMYDNAIFKNCEYKRHDYDVAGVHISTFELRKPKYEPEKCESSYGYKLLHSYFGENWHYVGVLIFGFWCLGDVWEGLFYAFIFSFIFYFFFETITTLAADITSGPSVASVTASISAMIKDYQKAKKFVDDVKKGDGAAAAGKGGEESGDSTSRENSTAASSEREGSEPSGDSSSTTSADGSQGGSTTTPGTK